MKRAEQSVIQTVMEVCGGEAIDALIRVAGGQTVQVPDFENWASSPLAEIPEHIAAQLKGVLVRGEVFYVPVSNGLFTNADRPFKAIEMRDQGKSVKEIAACLGVSQRCVYYWIEKRNKFRAEKRARDAKRNSQQSVEDKRQR